MPDLNWNVALWNSPDSWQTGGEEWSEAWGGSEAQWYGSLLPRLHRCLPADRILEIAPGYGRWTKYLLGQCRDYVGIDLSAECVAACRRTFADRAAAAFFQNDGLSLDRAPDGQFDLVFSFDSLVHVELEVLESYLPQILSKLRPDGYAFVHHSNLRAVGDGSPDQHSRAPSVSAEEAGRIIANAGGRVLVQERINWGGERLNDCLSLFCRSDHRSTGIEAQLDNTSFMAEARIIQAFQAPYARV